MTAEKYGALSTTPIRLFLSYGHDANAPLVLRIHQDLVARGHEVWIDRSEIKTGQHWRRSIFDGVSQSSGVVAFLSKHSTRDPGVCRDELRIAVAAKGCYIQTVLLEPERDVQPPAIATETQWLDLSDWRQRQDDGDDAFEKWYGEQFMALCAAIESPDAMTLAGEITELKTLLRPILIDQKERDMLASPFVGREWLVQALENWRVHERDSRAFIIFGTPGAGKSAFAVDRLSEDPHAVCGILCEWDKPSASEPRQVVRTMAFKLATKLPDYRSALRNALREGRDLSHASVSELFAWLITEPLSLLPAGHDRARVYIVLDALDEAPSDDLAELLATQLRFLPPWIGIVATSRPEPDLVNLFTGFSPVVLDADNPANTQDILNYLREMLSGLGVDESLLHALSSNAEGSFWHARLTAENVASNGVGSIEPGARGLSALYRQWFRRAFPDEKSWASARNYLELMVADETLPVDALIYASRNNTYSFRSFVRTMGSLVTERTAGYDYHTTDGPQPRQVTSLGFCHKSITDWIRNEKQADRYWVDHRAGAARLIDFTWWAYDSLRTDDDHKIIDHLEEHHASYYCLAGKWQDYEAKLLSKWKSYDPHWMSFRARRIRRLWTAIDRFPAQWDLAHLHGALTDALQAARLSVQRGTFQDTRVWVYLFEIFRDAIQTQRLANVLFAWLREFPPGFLRSAASDECDFFSVNKTQMALHLAQSIRLCHRRGLEVPRQIESTVAEIAASSFYFLGQPHPDLAEDALRRSPEVFSVGILNSPIAPTQSAQNREDGWTRMRRVFNTCAAAYELTRHDDPDRQRLSALLDAGNQPDEIARIAANQRKLRVFLSAPINRVLDPTFAEVVRRAGADPLEVQAIRPGAPWKISMNNTLTAADAAVAYLDGWSQFAQREVEELIRLDKPILVMSPHLPPAGFDDLQVVALADPEQFTGALKACLPDLLARAQHGREKQLRARLLTLTAQA